MKCNFCGWLLALAMIFGGAQITLATTYVGSAYEPFNYTAASQLTVASGLNGGTGWNATGDSGSANPTASQWADASALPVPAPNPGGPDRSIVSPTLNYAGAPTYPAGTGLKAVISGANATNNVSRSIGQLVDSGTIYFSYLTTLENSTQRTTSFAFFGPANGVSGTPGNTPERVSIGQIGTATAGAGITNGNIGLLFNNVNSATANNVVNATTPIAYGTGVTHLIVGRVDFNAAGNDTLTLYVDPTSVAAEPATPYMQTSAFELTSFNSIRLFSGNAATINSVANPGAITDFDEIRLGTTFASVVTAAVPEPGTMALAVIGAFGLAGAYRRRRVVG